MEVAAAFHLVASVSSVNNARPRVLFVGAFPDPNTAVFGGMVTSCRALLASTLPERLDLDLLDSTQRSNPPPPLPVRAWDALRRFLHFLRRLYSARPDAVILFVSSGVSIVEKGAMAWAARLRRVPTIIFPRSGVVVDVCHASAFRRLWVKCFLRGARRVVCQSEVWRTFAIDSLGFATDDVEILQNWTASRELLEIGRERHDGHNSVVKLVYVGWLEQYKGIFELLHACKQLAGKSEFTLDIIGDGRASGQAQAFVRESGLDEVVCFRGWLGEGDVRKALATADVFVLPSWAEGLPNAMVEAMAAGVAVVVSRVGAIPDVVEHRRSGLLVPPRDVEQLAIALSDVIDDDKLRQQLADEAHKLAEDKFSAETAAGRIAASVAIVTGRSAASD